MFREIHGFSRELAEYDRTGTIPPRPTQEEIRNMMLRHARMQLEFKGEYLGIREMRKHVAWYVKGMKRCSEVPRTDQSDRILRRAGRIVEDVNKIERICNCNIIKRL